VVSVLDEAGGLLEADQRAVVRFVIQEGWGADIVFAAGTTGEWDRLGNDVRQRVIQLCSEEVAKANARLGPDQGRALEAWAGVTAHSPDETLENLEFAIEHGADAAVLAPLSIRGIDDPVRFVARDVADLLDRRPRRIPVMLYDNAEIAVDPKLPHIRTRQVKAMSRLDFVRGIKVSARRKVLGNYTKAAASFRERGEFYWLRGGLPTGVVAGPANALPREWARAWQVSRAGDAERMEQVREVLEAFRACTHRAGSRRSIACLKRALLAMGVISSAAVAGGTPALARPDAERFDESFAGVRAMVRRRIGEPWVTRVPGEGSAQGALS
jgi:dihydrodipicolinate synthase/N-acetylneuraminate lyase